MLIKMTLGLWDAELISTQQIKYRGGQFDLNLLDPFEKHEEMISVVGESHSIIWLFIPLFAFFTKLGEALNACHIFVFDDTVRFAMKEAARRQEVFEAAEREAEERGEKRNDMFAEDASLGIRSSFWKHLVGAKKLKMNMASRRTSKMGVDEVDEAIPVGEEKNRASVKKVPGQEEGTGSRGSFSGIKKLKSASSFARKPLILGTMSLERLSMKWQILLCSKVTKRKL